MKTICKEIYKNSRFFNIEIIGLFAASCSKFWGIRTQVVLNQNCPIELLIKLSKDKEDVIRYYVAKHKNSTIELLIELNKDKFEGVRESVKKHPTYIQYKKELESSNSNG